MRPEDIDNLFRGKLENHDSPLSDPLWARMQERMQQQASPENPVDELFKRKLQQHPTPLPAGLWERIEARLQGSGEHKVRPMWVWYAAACIALLLSVAGVWQYQVRQPELVAVEIPAATGTAPAQTETAATPAPALADATQAQQPEQQQSTKTPVTDNTSRAKEQQPLQAQPKAAGTPAPEAATPVTPAPAPVAAPKTQPLPQQQQPQLAVNAPAEPKKAPLEQKQETQYSQPIVVGNPPQLAQAEPLRVDVILASENTEVDNTPEETESRFSKAKVAKNVVKQIWKLKNGEKPDLQELGLASSYTMQVQTKNRTLSKTINL